MTVIEQPQARSTPAGRLREIALFVCLLAALLALIILRPTAEPPANAAELGFARDMIVHHAQAVDMAMLLYDRTDNPDLKTIALDMALTQQAQLGQMQGWLSVWGEPIASADLPMAWMDMAVSSGLMPGMATDDELASLRAADGSEADALFIPLMIAHHQGGVHMAQGLLARSDTPIVRRLAQSIIDAQQREIALLESLRP
ncbi:MAG: DUF305 domain-containing protein [Chloroflexi bacterium]|uniref:DUF305 domain-containing protein n=1 Tax=Candidatus Flexifilum breve TaxID=3140694 RepID=UPI0031372E6A|nr:DUF305 domain-containing protein [Chloroflexota bacterium]